MTGVIHTCHTNTLDYSVQMSHCLFLKTDLTNDRSNLLSRPIPARLLRPRYVLTPMSPSLARHPCHFLARSDVYVSASELSQINNIELFYIQKAMFICLTLSVYQFESHKYLLIMQSVQGDIIKTKKFTFCQHFFG